MKWVYLFIGIIVGIPTAFFGTIYAASELGGEVVVLHRQNGDGSVSRVRIWIVEDDEGTWVEHGDADAAWLTALDSVPVITLERAGESRQYHAIAEPDLHQRYHELRLKKYGLADQLIELMTGDVADCTGVPVRLDGTEVSP